MGKVIVLRDEDFSSENLGKVRFGVDIPVTGVVINLPDEIKGDFVDLSEYAYVLPTETQYQGISFSTETEGVSILNNILVIPSGFDGEVTIKASSTHDSSKYALQTIRASFISALSIDVADVVDINGAVIRVTSDGIEIPDAIVTITNGENNCKLYGNNIIVGRANGTATIKVTRYGYESVSKTIQTSLTGNFVYCANTIQGTETDITLSGDIANYQMFGLSVVRAQGQSVTGFKTNRDNSLAIAFGAPGFEGYWNFGSQGATFGSPTFNKTPVWWSISKNEFALNNNIMQISGGTSYTPTNVLCIENVKYDTGWRDFGNGWRGTSHVAIVNGVSATHFLTAASENGVVGFKDLITDRFYPTANSGTTLKDYAFMIS